VRETAFAILAVAAGSYLVAGILSKAALRDEIVGLGCRALSLPFRAGGGRRPRGPFTRVVVLKPGSLGDVLMATPVVRALRRSLPDTYLAFAVGSWSLPVIAGNPRLDAVLDLGSLGSRGFGLGECRAAVRLLRSGRYDGAIVLDRAPLIALLPFLAGIPRRVGLDSDGRGFALTARVPCPPRRHEVDLYLDVALAAGCAVSDPRLEFFPTPEDEAAVAAMLASVLPVAAATPDLPLVAIHPAGGVNPGMHFHAKRWPASRFAALADRFRDELGAAVLLIGGRDDRAVIEELRAALRRPAVDLAGKLTWGQVGALLGRCRLLVANDTGAAHLAGAVGTPAVVIFGPTDPAQFGPYAGHGEAVVAGVPCRPCFRRGRFPNCRYAQRCLGELDVSSVWAAVRRQWAGRVANPVAASTTGGRD